MKMDATFPTKRAEKNEIRNRAIFRKKPLRSISRFAQSFIAADWSAVDKMSSETSSFVAQMTREEERLEMNLARGGKFEPVLQTHLWQMVPPDTCSTVRATKLNDAIVISHISQYYV